MRVGLFGGSFDPVHQAHLKLAAAALRQLKLARVYFVVSPRSPFKIGRKRTSGVDRFRLVRLALRGQPHMSAANWELKRPGLSYTITTLMSYQRRNPAHELFLILGTDALKGFARWRRPADIARRATLVVGRRPGAAGPPALPRNIPATVVRLKGSFPDVSSTAIRTALRAERRPRGVAPAVYREIVGRKLYR